MTCVPFRGGVVCFADERRRYTKRKTRKWCFRCRRRTMHRWVVWWPKKFSPYDPHANWECPVCKEDNTVFPGREAL